MIYLAIGKNITTLFFCTMDERDSITMNKMYSRNFSEKLIIILFNRLFFDFMLLKIADTETDCVNANKFNNKLNQ